MLKNTSHVLRHSSSSVTSSSNPKSWYLGQVTYKFSGVSLLFFPHDQLVLEILFVITLGYGVSRSIHYLEKNEGAPIGSSLHAVCSVFQYLGTVSNFSRYSVIFENAEIQKIIYSLNLLHHLSLYQVYSTNSAVPQKVSLSSAPWDRVAL